MQEGVRRADRERGSALVIALLVTVVLALLGISFLLMAETENRIAQNERLSAQAYFAGQSTLRVVKSWFDSPAGGVAVPALADVDRTRRRIIDETDPYDPNDVTNADGTLGSAPYYKQGVDLDGDTLDDIFDRPYRVGALHQFLGTEDGPDIVIDEADSTSAVYLRALEQTLLPGYPGNNLAFRIARIDLFAPPYARVAGGGWGRYGLATVRVLVRLLNTATGRVAAEREVTAMLGEVPYWGAYGPLHSCAELTLTGTPMTVHWGAVTAVESMRLPATIGDLPSGLPRELPVVPRADALLSTLSWADWTTEVAGQAAEDPWVRFLPALNLVAPAVPTDPHPYPSPWGGWTSGDPPPGPCCDVYSHVFQDQLLVGCPYYDYDDWKAVATSGERGVHYFSWDGTRFVEDGVGAAGTLQALTDGREGIFFFDTTDGLAPHDDDLNGAMDNLTPAITITGGWDFRGVLYANAVSFGFNAATGVDRQIRAPGEPFLDADSDGAFDAGESFVNLDYPTTSGTAFDAPTILDAGIRDDRGPAITMPVSMHGLLINQGAFEATGTGTVYGSVVAVGGVTQVVADGSQPTPRLIFDASILDGFPPVGWDLPRVTVTGWVTERE
ncbi:MAG: hypothetical protein GTN89_03380 [Acidobacteria bacterium]|nr:hypothetical protein [Acidobacteriota bacterium]NIM62997.1 hypothetical protein [Acidobacteriota bacterium]NIO58371.1 hypothetical protein [Acidobacteriota bacterium]NIQ29422.1 hypothetical protein [Acidobacteriota bacterium]NIQ84045.1 hypothetical protein [Acidobacteriota bacterium]